MFHNSGRMVDHLLAQVRTLTAANHQLEAVVLVGQRNLTQHYMGRFDQVTLENHHLKAEIEALNEMHANDAQAQVHLVEAEDDEWAQEFVGLGNFYQAHSEVDQLEQENNQLKEENDHLRLVQDIFVTDCVEAERKQADLEKEKSSWVVEKAQMMATMAKMEAEASSREHKIAALKVENEAHKAAALQGTASLALSEMRTFNAQSMDLTAMEQAKLTLKDEVVFEVLADGARKRQAEEREQDRANKRQRL